ncbi:hypothetical protein ANCCAN_14880 [Ancylostoma caninum]|uniref:Uncharacterized protein n=1 Tax=Ancylostoma caninum TaxID=29170 RepID=A0A368G424_ANCCA|nr:hypothetical protein ANCCAN_14880 [Ancylostoma caninum]
MSFMSSIQAAFRRITVSPKKDRGCLLEPPFLPIPTSPEQNENFYVIDESFTSLSINDEADKTFYENETFNMYTSDVDFVQGRNAGKRKRSFTDVELCRASFSLMDLKSTPTRLLQENSEPKYSPPAKRAPILRRFRARLTPPPYRPPAVPPLNENDEEHYIRTKGQSESSSSASSQAVDCAKATEISC